MSNNKMQSFQSFKDLSNHLKTKKSDLTFDEMVKQEVMMVDEINEFVENDKDNFHKIVQRLDNKLELRKAGILIMNYGMGYWCLSAPEDVWEKTYEDKIFGYKTVAWWGKKTLEILEDGTEVKAEIDMWNAKKKKKRFPFIIGHQASGEVGWIYDKKPVPTTWNGYVELQNEKQHNRWPKGEYVGGDLYSD